MSNDLILSYQQTGDKKIGDQLLDLHKNYIKANVNKWSGILPQAVMEAHGKQLALNAFNTFNPDKGANINTHLYNHLSQLSRLVYEHQNIAKMSEHQIQKIGLIDHATKYLEDEYGRPPTIEEISDHVYLPVEHVQRIIKNNRKDFLNDSDAETQQFATGHDFSAKERIFATRQSLSPLQRSQFDDLTGFNGSKPLELSEFGKKYKMKPYEVSRLKTALAKRFK